MTPPRFTVEDLELFVKQGLIAQATIEQLPEYKRAVRAAERAVPKSGATRRRLARPEQDMQRALCAWWALQYPESWEFTFHTPNGLAAKNRKLAAIFKGLGLKPGVPDLLCLQRRGRYTGFALELKDRVGVGSANQYAWADRLKAQAWYVGMAWRLDDAMAMVTDYNSLAIGRPRLHVGEVP